MAFIEIILTAVENISTLQSRLVILIKVVSFYSLSQVNNTDVSLDTFPVVLINKSKG